MNAINAISGNGFKLQTATEKFNELREEYADFKKFKKELEELNINGG